MGDSLIYSGSRTTRTIDVALSLELLVGEWTDDSPSVLYIILSIGSGVRC